MATKLNCFDSGKESRCRESVSRKPYQWKKNPAMIRAGAAPATHPGAIVAQYKALRSAVLGQALPPEARSGLIVLLRQGM